jgi:hypothetical protein
MAYSECLPTRLNPLAERTRFSQVSGWPIPVKSVRVGEHWVQRSRYPKADPTNYSSGWLSHGL